VIFASTTKVDGTLGTYVDRSQTTPKCASILHPVDIENENITHKEPQISFVLTKHERNNF
jgi:hypothetical protein